MANILVIDDDPSICLALQLVLKQLGHKAITAGDGRSGLATYRSTKFDLVVTDIIMPQMEGIETVMALRRCCPTVKIIAMSGGGRCGADEYLSLACKLGAKRTLTKPFSMEDFSTALSEALLDN